MALNLAFFASFSLQTNRALFTNWSRPGKTVFEILGFSADIMQLIIQFAYTGIVSVTEDVVQDLLFAADQLLVIGVIHACWDFLEEHLSPENCIGIWQFSNICYYPRLQHKFYQYIIDNFEEVSYSTEVTLLSLEEISGIFARDDLIVRHEESVYRALHRWITQAPEERTEHLAWLFSKV